MSELLVFLDLETLPPEMTDEELLFFKENLEYDKRLRDPEKIAAWKEDNWEDKYRSLAKKSSTATIATFGFAFNEEEAECIYCPERNEKEVLNAFYEDLTSYLNSSLDEDVTYEETNYNIKWCGFNNRTYDMDLLWKRCVYYGLYDLAKMIPRDRFSKNVIDMKEVFQGPNVQEYRSQDFVCKYFGIEGKPEGVNGSNVYEYWMRGEYQEIAEYNKDDVNKVRLLYKKMFNK
jgi:hypothetical protein